MSEAKQKSVENLKDLYSIIVGVALSYAIYTIIDTHQKTIPVKFSLLPCFVAFIVTLIPFYHGALRHLDRTYVESGGKQTRGGALLADFLLLFAEACLLLILAVLLAAPGFFVWALATLFALDAIWGFAAHLAFTQDVGSKPEVKWAVLNLITTAVLAVCLFELAFPPSALAANASLLPVVAIVTIVRTVLDYVLCWGFYYPED